MKKEGKKEREKERKKERKKEKERKKKKERKKERKRKRKKEKERKNQDQRVAPQKPSQEHQFIIKIHHPSTDVDMKQSIAHVSTPQLFYHGKLLSTGKRKHVQN